MIPFMNKRIVKGCFEAKCEGASFYKQFPNVYYELCTNLHRSCISILLLQSYDTAQSHKRKLRMTQLF